MTLLQMYLCNLHVRPIWEIWLLCIGNVGSRLVWGFSIVRSFAEIVQNPLGSFGGAQLCEVARPNKMSLRIVQPFLFYFDYDLGSNPAY